MEQAARTPDATALVSGAERLTYAELERRVRPAWPPRCAAGASGRRRGWGSAPSARLELVVALLGVLKAGGAYVPLDPAYPAERVAFLLEDSALPVRR